MFDRFLSLSDRLRPEFSASLGTSSQRQTDSVTLDGNPLPAFLRAIYSKVQGTPAGIQEQSLMDFIPGYRLIHISELEGCYETCAKIMDSRQFLPFLANYSSDFFCWKDGQIFEVAHDRPTPCLVHENEERFYDTICEFYEKGVYFLEDGYLDYDYEQERIVGTAINPGVDYWQED